MCLRLLPIILFLPFVLPNNSAHLPFVLFRSIKFLFFLHLLSFLNPLITCVNVYYKCTKLTLSSLFASNSSFLKPSLSSLFNCHHLRSGMRKDEYRDKIVQKKKETVLFYHHCRPPTSIVSKKRTMIKISSLFSSSTILPTTILSLKEDE